MPPRGFTNPAPKTESAREAVKSFYCELCSKGYSRMNEYEAHLSSYDHSHKQRLKDMRQLTRDPLASEKARRAEAKANAGSGLISIKIGDGGASGSGGAAGGGLKKGFKKAGFKSAFAPAEGSKDEDTAREEPARSRDPIGSEVKLAVYEGGNVDGDTDVESDTEEEGYEMYDPRHPTD